eukprot:352055-Chlamydomonas_euryale.AAC.3
MHLFCPSVHPLSVCQPIHSPIHPITGAQLKHTNTQTSPVGHISHSRHPSTPAGLQPHEPFLYAATNLLQVTCSPGRIDLSATALSALGHSRPPDSGPGEPLVLVPLLSVPQLCMAVGMTWKVGPRVGGFGMGNGGWFGGQEVSPEGKLLVLVLLLSVPQRCVAEFGTLKKG